MKEILGKIAKFFIAIGFISAACISIFVIWFVFNVLVLCAALS